MGQIFVRLVGTGYMVPTERTKMIVPKESSKSTLLYDIEAEYDTLQVSQQANEQRLASSHRVRRRPCLADHANSPHLANIS